MRQFSCMLEIPAILLLFIIIILLFWMRIIYCRLYYIIFTIKMRSDSPQTLIITVLFSWSLRPVLSDITRAQ